MMRVSLLRLLLMALLLGATALALAYRDRFEVAELRAWLEHAGHAAPLAFVGIYAAATVLFLPGSVLTLAGGALFGPALGTFCSLTGATIGATLAFLIARYLTSDWVVRKTHKHMGRLMQGVEAEGWRFVAFVRLVPLFPFNLLNYALGLTRIRLAHYVVASYLCMLPGALAYTYLGYAGREAVTGSEGMIQKGLLALALLALVVFLPRFVAQLRQGPMLEVEELARRLATGEETLVLDVRGADEFNGPLRHIAGAYNVPIDQLQQKLPELAAFRDKFVALVCRTDRRSAQAAQVLSRAGFTHLHIVRGGMEAWTRRRLPTEANSVDCKTAVGDEGTLHAERSAMRGRV